MAWPNLSASRTGAPSSWSMAATVLLPEPIPPVSPIVIIGRLPLRSDRVSLLMRLKVVEVAEEAAFRDQLRERTAFSELSIAKHQYRTGVLDRRQPMRDHQCRSTTHHLLHGSH